MTQTERASPRSWRAHALAVVLCALGAVGGFAGGTVTLLTDFPACTADYSEDTIVAPASNRGWLVCSVTDDGRLADGPIVLVVLLALPVLLGLAGLIVWVRAKRFWALLPILTAALLLPWVWGGITAALSPDCNENQWAEHGPSGCERNEEIRPGINQR